MKVLYARVEFTNNNAGRNARNRSVTQAQTEAANRGLSAVSFTWPYDGFSYTGAAARDIATPEPGASRYVLYLAFGSDDYAAVEQAAYALQAFLDSNGDRLGGELGTADFGG